MSASKRRHAQSKLSNICNILGDVSNARYSVLRHQGCVSYMKQLHFHCSHFHLQGEEGDDGKVEGPPGPPGDIVSHT